MALSDSQSMKVPTTAIVVVDAPNPLLLLDERKRHRASHRIEIEAQKQRVGNKAVTVHNWAFSCDRSVNNLMDCGKAAQRLIDKGPYIHWERNPS